MGSVHPLRELWEQKGFPTASQFAATAGLKDYELSRIVSGTSPRRPTWTQIRRMAPILGVSSSELARMLLPPGDPETEHHADVVEERNELLRELGEVRLALTTAEAELRSRVSEIADLTTRHGAALYDLDTRSDQLRAVQAERARLEDELRTERRARTALDTKLVRLEGDLATARSAADAVREQAGRELEALREQLAALRTSSSDELAKERTRAIEKQIMSGALGAIAGAVITAVARGASDPEDETTD